MQVTGREHGERSEEEIERAREESGGTARSFIADKPSALHCLLYSWKVLEGSMCSRGWDRHLALELPLLHLLVLAASIQGDSVDVINAVSGGNVTLNISESLPENVQGITWFYTYNLKIADWDVRRLKYFENRFKGRVRLDSRSGALYMSKVQKEDANIYIMRVLKKTMSEQEWKIRLQVFDPVPKPDIKIEKTEKVEDDCYLKLSCVIPDESVSHTWYGDKGPFPKEFQSGVLETTLKSQDYSRCYTCQVSNPVSSENDTVCFSPPCTLVRSFAVEWIASWLVMMVPTTLGLLFT
ncbi:CD48 antigen [Cebus imitator]|uniref:CD48 antigen n=1 Tax=Cebus imitator TaxID=2715852 RepID=UPI000809B923|nr:CD48 antigen [Cebus imitator]